MSNGSARARYMRTPRAPISAPTLARSLPPVVYFLRMEDGIIKIGWTGQLGTRISQLGRTWTDILAILPGSLADEKAMHAEFAEHLAHHKEYFHPAPRLLAKVNLIRQGAGVEPI
jgi:hypothetical protein